MKKFRNWIEEAIEARLAFTQPTFTGYRGGRKCYELMLENGTRREYFIDFEKQTIEAV